jgi:hypothetical protein
LFLGTKRAKRKYYYGQNESVVEKAQQDPHCFWGQNERKENIIVMVKIIQRSLSYHIEEN